MTYSRLANPRETRAVLEDFGLATKHRLGQNFLVNDEVIGRIVNLAELDGNDVVLEVGPGIGTLTVAMLSACRAVCSIEADRELEQVLAQTCATDGEKFALVMGDALRVTPAQVDDALAGLTKGQSLCQPFRRRGPCAGEKPGLTPVAAAAVQRYKQPSVWCVHLGPSSMEGTAPSP